MNLDKYKADAWNIWVVDGGIWKILLDENLNPYEAECPSSARILAQKLNLVEYPEKIEGKNTYRIYLAPSESHDYYCMAMSEEETCSFLNQLYPDFNTLPEKAKVSMRNILASQDILEQSLLWKTFKFEIYTSLDKDEKKAVEKGLVKGLSWIPKRIYHQKSYQSTLALVNLWRV